MSRRPRLADLFSCAGGAARGYHDAGFEVVGFDLVEQPRYPYEHHVADALDVDLDGFDAVHASPPCQMFSAYRRAMPDRGDNEYVNLIPQTREKLQAWGGPYVIENVPGAPLEAPVLLCGSMFDPMLDVQRHRGFETNWGLRHPVWPCRHKLWGPRFDRGSRQIRPRDRKTCAIGEWRIPLEVQQAAIGIDWMTVAEMSQAVPPEYTRHIGAQLLEVVGSVPGHGENHGTARHG